MECGTVLKQEQNVLVALTARSIALPHSLLIWHQLPAVIPAPLPPFRLSY